MNNVDNINSPIGTLVEILTNAQKMNSFEFDDMTTTLVNMWAEPQHPLGRSIIDYVIMAAINQKDFKGLKRIQYIEMTYILVPIKVKKASIEILENNEPNTGLLTYL